jgi:hypothetical protein
MARVQRGEMLTFKMAFFQRLRPAFQALMNYFTSVNAASSSVREVTAVPILPTTMPAA